MGDIMKIVKFLQESSRYFVKMCNYTIENETNEQIRGFVVCYYIL